MHECNRQDSDSQGQSRCNHATPTRKVGSRRHYQPGPDATANGRTDWEYITRASSHRSLCKSLPRRPSNKDKQLLGEACYHHTSTLLCSRPHVMLRLYSSVYVDDAMTVCHYNGISMYFTGDHLRVSFAAGLLDPVPLKVCPQIPHVTHFHGLPSVEILSRADFACLRASHKSIDDDHEIGVLVLDLLGTRRSMLNLHQWPS